MKKNKIIMALICYILLAICVIVVFVCELIADIKSKSQEKEVIEVQMEQPIVDSLPKDEIVQEEKKTEIYLLTAYCPCLECSEGYGNMTATGKRAVEGRTIAVDPKIIPYGTELYIDGVGYRIAEDCGGLVKGKHIDVYFDCHSKVDAFGKRYAEVEI